MPMRLSSNDSNFESQFAALLGQKREVSSDIDDAVRAIIADVRARGDAALAELTLKYDRLDLQRAGLAITAAEIESALAACSKETLDALYFACDRIADHHKRQLPSDDRYRDAAGVELGHRWTAVESAGLYVPGGLGAAGANEKREFALRNRQRKRDALSFARRVLLAHGGEEEAGEACLDRMQCDSFELLVRIAKSPGQKTHSGFADRRACCQQAQERRLR